MIGAGLEKTRKCGHSNSPSSSAVMEEDDEMPENKSNVVAVTGALSVSHLGLSRM